MDIAGFSDRQLRRTITGVVLPRDQAEIGTNVAASTKARCVSYREHER
jgi:hypothetical protein